MALEIQIIAVFIAVACAVLGVFLVLRRMSMMSDSITHTILLGIVLAFWVTRDLGSPLLIVGASLMGVLTVWLTETLAKTKRIAADSAIGLVFPLLFSVAIIIISRHMGHLHLHTDTVLLGELAFAPFDRLIINGVDFGARFLYTSGVMLAINLLFVSVFYKELKLVSFDPTLATVLGFSVHLLHYGLMTLVSLTTVVAFEAVGAILVVAFMVGPAAAAYLLTKKLLWMLLLSAGIGALSAILGFQVAIHFDVSIAGSMASVIGAIFMLVFIFSPSEGLISSLIKKNQRKKAFSERLRQLHLSKYPAENQLKSKKIPSKA
ncbi:MAG: metal ABC transporter permease [Turicibacter sp.]|nr:metal ABC transporter permease [Turicibacter sp.]